MLSDSGMISEKLINLMNYLHQSLNINKLKKIPNLQVDPEISRIAFMRDGGLCRKSAALCYVFLLDNHFSPLFSASKGFITKFLKLTFSWNSRRQR